MNVNASWKRRGKGFGVGIEEEFYRLSQHSKEREKQKRKEG